MRGCIGLSMFVLLSCFPGCSRDFEEPPPQVVLQAVWPTTGFTGEAVALCATNLDTEALNNLVSFGTVPVGPSSFEEPTDWAEPESTDFECAQAPLYVRVPVLPTEGWVSIQIENATGQTVLPVIPRAFEEFKRILKVW